MRFLPFAVATIAGLASAQSPNRSTPVFDAASLKPGGHDFIPLVSGRMKGGPGTDDPGRITYTQLYLVNFVMTAWGIQEYQLSGPAWFTKTSPDEVFTITATMQPDTTKEQFHLMLQNLLVERFHMKVHREIRNLPGYELVVAPGGSKLKLTTQAPDAPTVSPLNEIGPDGFTKLPQTGRARVQMMSKDRIRYICQASSLAEFVEPYLRSLIFSAAGPGFGPITDKTGLTARYDFQLEFGAGGGLTPVLGPNVQPRPDRDTATDPGSGVPNLFTALEKQLGLKLVKVKSVPVEMLVIDSGDKSPTPN